MSGYFNDEKYQIASQKALDFIKHQLNVNDYSLFPRFVEDYSDAYTSRVIARVNMPDNAKINYPKYIYCDQFYDEKYQGVIKGKFKNIKSARKNLAVEVTTQTDQEYRSAICFLHEDGTWKSEVYYRETDYYGVGDLVTHTITYWYRKDVVINPSGSNGIKGFKLKYYNWVDDEGHKIDVDHLPGSTRKEINPVPIDPETGEPKKTSLLYSKTYTLKPTLIDDTIIDDALPRYADFDASLYVYSDVEYLTETTNIVYDGIVIDEDLPVDPPVLPDEPTPFIRDAFVQPYTQKGQLIITWITNFIDDCTLDFDGNSMTVSGGVVVPGYYTYHQVVEASLNENHTYTISGKGEVLSKSFRYNDSNRYLIAGDPQIIAQDSANYWYQIQNILDPLPAMIISMGDQVDAITDALVRTEQYHLYTEQHSVPIVTIRGNHDKNTHFFGHFGLPGNAEGANFYFKNNDALFISIDTNSSDCEAHKMFIKKALEVNEYRWAILLMHHSLFSTAKSSLTTHVRTLREGLTDFIVNETDICMVIAGHEHFLCRTNYPGKLFFTAATCTGSKYGDANYQTAPWADVTIDIKKPIYTVMDVTDAEIILNTYTIDGQLIDSVSVFQEVV